MKICYKCNIPKSLSCFSKNASKPDGLQSACKDCWKSLRREHYISNKQRYIDKSTLQKKRTKEWFIKYKSTLFCKECGENHPATLDFHHRDPKQKEKLVSSLVYWSLPKLKKEIDKCDVLCANCHRKHHWNGA